MDLQKINEENLVNALNCIHCGMISLLILMMLMIYIIDGWSAFDVFLRRMYLIGLLLFVLWINPG
jgi:hypothetical protein